MLPYIGQGACMAIEDGYTLAAVIAQMPEDLNKTHWFVTSAFAYLGCGPQ